jgi:FixJ family two-component response regulator
VIAVVDDEELVRTGLQRLLKTFGYTVIAFESAEEFLSSGRLPEVRCLVADIRMPGMSGIELQANLKADGWHIPIIFITAHGDAKMRIRAMRDGAVEFLTKPFDNEVLLETVHAAVEDYAKALGFWNSNQ